MLYNIYLKLSSRPTIDWRNIFKAERSFPRHSMWREAWVEGDYIIIYCVPEELERYHLNDLKQDVSSCNAKYRKYLYETIQKENDTSLRKKKEREQFENLKNRLNFE